MLAAGLNAHFVIYTLLVYITTQVVFACHVGTAWAVHKSSNVKITCNSPVWEAGVGHQGQQDQHLYHASFLLELQVVFLGHHKLQTLVISDTNVGIFFNEPHRLQLSIIVLPYFNAWPPVSNNISDKGYNEVFIKVCLGNCVYVCSSFEMCIYFSLDVFVK